MMIIKSNGTSSWLCNYSSSSYSVLLYIAILTPYKIAYYDSDVKGFFSIDVSIDILFFVDIIMSFFVAYFNDH